MLYLGMYEEILCGSQVRTERQKGMNQRSAREVVLPGHMAHAVAILPSRLVSTIPRTCDGLHDSISRVANLHVASMRTRSSDMAVFEDDDPDV